MVGCSIDIVKRKGDHQGLQQGHGPGQTNTGNFVDCVEGIVSTCGLTESEDYGKKRTKSEEPGSEDEAQTVSVQSLVGPVWMLSVKEPDWVMTAEIGGAVEGSTLIDSGAARLHVRTMRLPRLHVYPVQRFVALQCILSGSRRATVHGSPVSEPPRVAGDHAQGDLPDKSNHDARNGANELPRGACRTFVSHVSGFGEAALTKAGDVAQAQSFVGQDHHKHQRIAERQRPYNRGAVIKATGREVSTCRSKKY